MQQQPNMAPAEVEEEVEVEVVEATPEENAMLDKALRAALQPLTGADPKQADAIDKQLMASGSMPERNLAHMAVPLIEMSEKAVGQPIVDEDMFEQLVKNVLDELIAQAMDLGAIDLSKVDVTPDEFLEVVFIEFLITWFQKYPDRMDDEDRAEMAETMAERQQAQQSEPPVGSAAPGQPAGQQQTPVAQGVQQASGGGGYMAQARQAR